MLIPWLCMSIYVWDVDQRLEQAQRGLQQRIASANITIASARQQSSHRATTDLLYLHQPMATRLVNVCAEIEKV